LIVLSLIVITIASSCLERLRLRLRNDILCVEWDVKLNSVNALTVAWLVLYCMSSTCAAMCNAFSRAFTTCPLAVELLLLLLNLCVLNMYLG